MQTSQRVVSNEQRVENNEQREEKPVKHLRWNFIVSTRWLTGSLLKNRTSITIRNRTTTLTSLMHIKKAKDKNNRTTTLALLMCFQSKAVPRSSQKKGGNE